MKKFSSMTISGFWGKTAAGAFARVLLALAAFLGWMAWTGEAVAQIPAPTRVKAEITDVKVIMQKTPEFQAATSEGKKDPKRREWLELEVGFKTDSDSRVGIIPELMITYYLLVQGAERQVLSGSFTYSNIVDKEENFAVVYVSPHALTRLTGEPNKFRLGNVQAMGVEILYQGRVVAESPDAKKFAAAATIPKISDMILPKEKTPFSLLWIDRHAELKGNP